MSAFLWSDTQLFGPTDSGLTLLNHVETPSYVRYRTQRQSFLTYFLGLFGSHQRFPFVFNEAASGDVLNDELL